MYAQILLIGATQLADRCRAILDASCACPVRFLDVNRHSKAEIMEQLQGIAVPTLAFSIMNPYIFPKETLAEPHLTIVNLHHGLLPGHRGRNAQAWAIFHEEKEAGITWHFVDAGIDTGKILKIDTIPIAETDTSLTLMRRQNACVPQSLRELLPALLSGSISAVRPTDRPSFLHQSADIPGNGRLDLSWSGHKMSCFLRAMDFGVLKVLGTPSLLWKHRLWTFRSYQIEQKEHPFGTSDHISVTQNAQDIVIQKEHYQITLYKIRPLSHIQESEESS